MRTPPLVRMALGCLLLLAGCHRKTGPSADFANASASFSRIYAQKLDDAYLDPRMDDILTQLHKVPLTSVDSQEAQALEVRINTNHERMVKEQEQRNQAAQRALQVVDNIVPSRSPIFPASEDAAVDGGPLDQPTAGMARAEFEQRFSGCFQMSSPVNVEGRGTRDAFELKDIANCRDRHPGFDRLLVLIEGNLVLGVIPKTAVNIESTVVDAGTAQNTAPAEQQIAQPNQGLPPAYRPPLVDRVALPDGGWAVPPLPPALAAPSTTPSADSVPDAG